MQKFSLNIITSRIIILSFFIASFYLPLFSQQPVEQNDSEPVVSIPDKIMEESDGNVEILIDPELMNSIMEAPHGAAKPKRSSGHSAPKVSRGKMTGFRIQVFSDGRNQSSLEARAKARGTAIVARFPKYRGQVYTYSSAPNWVTRIGNFQTASEANAALGELKRSFPGFAGEMRIVKTEIYIIR